ncbi:hypothetical protein N658DRAFT_214129 [Parathielavia hyrcaniae]|uniref:Uncharacterized protein n=1 Tax=Parathielavia hyrcaniae TaxID=113614 RepID=A0AAN6SZM1_9PEZI|nr:hypothetical protein N658DRAFT_214129 [Parathielavia hyrcaniae]
MDPGTTIHNQAARKWRYKLVTWGTPPRAAVSGKLPWAQGFREAIPGRLEPRPSPPHLQVTDPDLLLTTPLQKASPSRLEPRQNPPHLQAAGPNLLLTAVQEASPSPSEVRAKVLPRLTPSSTAAITPPQPTALDPPPPAPGASPSRKEIRPKLPIRHRPGAPQGVCPGAPVVAPRVLVCPRVFALVCVPREGVEGLFLWDMLLQSMVA